MLVASGLHHTFGRQPVLAGVDVSIAEGEVVGLWGPSGVGKSTLARILAGDLTPERGRVHFRGQPLTGAPPRPVQHVPQAPELAVDPRWRVARILANAGPPDPAVLAALEIRPAWLGRLPG